MSYHKKIIGETNEEKRIRHNANQKRWRNKEKNRLSENARNRQYRKKDMIKYRKSILFSTIRSYMRDEFLTLEEIEKETKDLSLRR